jgi:hypothetical protein
MSPLPCLGTNHTHQDRNAAHTASKETHPKHSNVPVYNIHHGFLCFRPRILRCCSQTDLSQSTVLASPQMHRGIAGQFGREISRDDWNKYEINRLLNMERKKCANIAIPVVNLGTMGISLPCSSRALWTEKAARKLAIAIQSDASAT